MTESKRKLLQKKPIMCIALSLILAVTMLTPLGSVFTNEKNSDNAYAYSLKRPQKVRIRGVFDSKKSVKITWYTSTGAVCYEIFVKEGSKGWKKAGTKGISARAFTYKKTSSKAVCHLKIRGVNKSGGSRVNGPFSDEQSTEPLKIKAEVRGNKITAKWNKVANYDKYLLECKEFLKRGYKKVAVTKKGSFTFKRQFCTRYTMRVKGLDKGNGRFSNEIEFETGSDPKLNRERILSLPSFKVNKKYTANRTDAIVFVGKDLWYLKSADGEGGYYPMVLCCIPNFEKYKNTQNAKKVTHKLIRGKNGKMYMAKHGSSLSYVEEEGNFYIATTASPGTSAPVIKVNRKGKVLDEIKVKGFETGGKGSGEDFSTCEFYKKDKKSGKLQFIVRNGKSEKNPERHRFAIGTLNGNLLSKTKDYVTKADRNSYFYMRGTDAGDKDPHCNDIHYDQKSGKLMHSVFVYDKGRKITKNWLYVYDFNKSVKRDKSKMHVNWTLLEQPDPPKTFNIKTKNCGEKGKFEIEGVAMYNGKQYLGINTYPVEDALYLVK